MPAMQWISDLVSIHQYSKLTAVSEFLTFWWMLTRFELVRRAANTCCAAGAEGDLRSKSSNKSNRSALAIVRTIDQKCLICHIFSMQQPLAIDMCHMYPLMQ